MKPLVPTIPMRVPPDLPHRVAALQDLHPGLLEQRGHLPAAVGVPVVVPEHGDHRRRDPAADVSEDRSLLRLAVRGQVAREQNEVGVALGLLEGGGDRVPVLLRAVDVARCGDADGAHLGGVPRGSRFANGDPGYPLSR